MEPHTEAAFVLALHGADPMQPPPRSLRQDDNYPGPGPRLILVVYHAY
jgi:hypothetical protein